jgi:glycine/D-amino acid oxidase-like deaminating enzyme
MAGWANVPNHSPWLAQLGAESRPTPLSGDATATVVVIGAGIAGVATAFFVLRETDLDVLLLEGDRAGRGATGHNAGQLTTYFERPLHDIARQFGEERAIEAQRAVDQANDLLDVMIAESGSTVRVERFVGHLGMYALDHLQVHLRDHLLRRRGGLACAACVVSADASFLHEIPAEFDGLYDVVPQAHVDDLLGVAGGAYRAVLSEPKGCANGALVVEQVVGSLQRRYADRFGFHDHTKVDQLELEPASVLLHTPTGHRVAAQFAVLCTNGYTGHAIVDRRGATTDRVLAHTPGEIEACVGAMAAYFERELRPPSATSFIRNERIGGDEPYVYVTRRTYERDDSSATLTCIGGPADIMVDDGEYDRTAPVPGDQVRALATHALPLADPARLPDEPFDFAWHGLMGYTLDRIRVIGPHPGDPRLMYNLGCNGVGFLPSIHGGFKVARLLAGDQFGPSIFDPRP